MNQRYTSTSVESLKRRNRRENRMHTYPKMLLAPLLD